MPELPEVETIRRQLDPVISGRRIKALRVIDERWARPARPRSVERAARRRRIERVERRGKYLILRLDRDRALLMHLRMTGNLLLASGAGRSRLLGGERLYEGSPDATRHLSARIELDSGDAVLFTDPRRFGHGAVLRGSELDAYLDERLGIEPFSDELTAEAILELAKGRKAPLKSFLLDQRSIAGIGNIYADEALHRAGLHPLSPAGSLRAQHADALRAGIRDALEAGLEAGGASMDDYLDARGERGSMQDQFLVHRREGLGCRRCGEPIERVVVSGRSTYFCPACQQRLRGRRAPARKRPARK